MSINGKNIYYEIINEQSLRVKIDLVLDDLYYLEEDKKIEELEQLIDVVKVVDMIIMIFMMRLIIKKINWQIIY